MWSALEGNTTSAAATDPATLLNTQLASALSLTGDAQYWEESIAPSTIRQSLAEADPSNPSSTQALLRGMKWLLANMSKGRNVADFYPHVVKLVGATSLEVRKMVYMYTVQYANYDASTRELSLLSINAFQRGLADSEQLIRALALRVLTSIQLTDILQIQILAVSKCATDRSPYVRKCAAHALAKLYVRAGVDVMQQEVLLQLLADWLAYDEATMVLTAACIALQEVCPDRLDLLHAAMTKITHLLTDMDEWGQVVVLDLLARYIRTYFAEPAAWKDGSAERIDQTRRVRRTLQGIVGVNNQGPVSTTATNTEYPSPANNASTADPQHNPSTASRPVPNKAMEAASQQIALPPRQSNMPQKIKRRVVRKGFYSDEEDESTEEEVFAQSLTGPALSVSAALRDTTTVGEMETPETLPSGSDWYEAEAADLHPDHRAILRSALSLLKSRNAGVVLAVCSLHYYCGVSSVTVRAALGKALVRIHRDQREIQYVVLASIRTLVTECPSAFSPFLHDFYVKALDPPFTRLIKLDILTSLALDPISIKAVLEELRSYVRHGDRKFATASVRAVGKVVELARIVHDRHGAAQGRVTEERRQADRIALNALAGLLTLTQTSDHPALVGQAVVVMQQILVLLEQTTDGNPVDDPQNVQGRVRSRLLLLLAYTLSKRRPKDVNRDGGIEEGAGAAMSDEDNDDSDDEDESAILTQLGQVVTVVLPASATASTIWLLGEYLISSQIGWSGQIHREVARLLVRCFPYLDSSEKEQAVHFASKLLVSTGADSSTGPLCEQILALGRLDVSPDVRDRSRFESNIIEMSANGSALKHDREALDAVPVNVSSRRPNVSLLFLSGKPQPSSLSLEKSNSHAGESDAFRFGTLSSLVGHRARRAYIALPPWALEDSSAELRIPKTRQNKLNNGSLQNGSSPTHLPSGKFYDEGESSSNSSGSSSSSSSSSDSSSESSSSSSDSDDSTTDGNRRQPHSGSTLDVFGSSSAPAVAPMTASVQVEYVSDSSESSSDDDSSSDESSGDRNRNTVPNSTAESVNVGVLQLHPPMMDMLASPSLARKLPDNGSSTVDDLKGLVVAPIVVDEGSKRNDPDFDRDSGAWRTMVRPEHSSGLSVQIRILRGVTRAREAQLMGLAAESPKVVCIQFRFTNAREDTKQIRRIRILQKSTSSAASMIAPRKAVVPPEIEQLGRGQTSDCVVGVEFASVSDRDGSLQAKFDVKFSSGATPIDIRPSLGDLLLSCKRSQSDFDNEIGRLQGFQRVESTLSSAWEGLEQSILDASALSPVKSSQSDHLRFVGTLPASSDTLLVSVRKGSESHKLTICSDNALAANSLLNVLKQFFSKN